MKEKEKSRLIIVGASGHGKVVADIAIKSGYKEVVFLDDNEEIVECAGFPVVGLSCMIESMAGDKFIAIGDAKVREELQQNTELVTLIHPNAIIARCVEIGKGTVIMPGAVVNSDTVICQGCIINTGATVDHDCLISEYVHISVGTHIAGNVKIGKNTWIGAGAVVSNNVNICSGCVIGAGAVVIRDINEPGVYVGVPTKRIK